jgi:hypothetical protein
VIFLQFKNEAGENNEHGDQAIYAKCRGADFPLKGRAEALYVAADPLVTANRIRINTWALGARLPTMHGFRKALIGCLPRSVARLDAVA